MSAMVTKLIFLTALIQLSTCHRQESPPRSSRGRFQTQVRGTTSCHSCHGRAVAEYNSSPPTLRRRTPAIIPDTYDFVIVGGGTAGCAVASRLAESGKHSVLILEYGDYPNPGLDIPALLSEYLTDENRKIYRSVPQTNAAFSNNGSFNYLVGRQLGGTSGLNGMAFNRGSPYNYNEWARMTGDTSWNYANLLKYFRKIEDYQGDYPSSTQHGSGGPITVSRPRYAPGLDEWFRAGRYLGYQVADPNGPQKVGFAPYEYSKRFGRRVSSYTGYIRPLLQSRQQHKLKVILKAEVKKITFEGDRAVGVIYEERDRRGRQFSVRANKEVVVSAGVINSPVILMKSGIGPRAVLHSAYVPVLKSLPVGRNLHDHMWFPMQMVLGDRSKTMIPERDLTPDNFRLYNETGDGPYAVFQGFPGQAFISSSLSTRGDWADSQIAMAASSSGASVLTGGTQEVQVAPREVLIRFTVFLTNPRSRGYVALNSTDPDQGDPIINFRYLAHPDDIHILREAVKTALRIFEDTPVYKRMGARYPTTPLPACAHLKFRSDEYWECAIRHIAGSGSHGAGSCKMGRENGDPDAVVNSQLKVFGFQNLRVIDASVMPKVTNANTQAAVYVIAEKGADMILNDWE